MSRGLEVAHFRWPDGPRQLRSVRRQLLETPATVGVFLTDLEPAERIHVVQDLAGLPSLQWLLLTDATEGPLWGAVVGAGVSTVLPLSTNLDHLVRVLTVGSDYQWMDDATRDRVVEQWRREQDERQRLMDGLASLTDREKQVLAMLHSGWAVRTIAQQAGVSEATVRSQVKSVLHKLEVRSQLAAVAAYRRVLTLGTLAPLAERPARDVSPRSVATRPDGPAPRQPAGS